jgi:hypothetical protein
MIPTIKTWQTPASDYPEISVGKAQLKSIRYNGAYKCFKQRDIQIYRASKLQIKVLIIDDKICMVDDPPHWWAIEEHATFYQGHVLVAGLGLGLIVHTLTANTEVKHITVIEKEQDVIDLISPFIPHDKLTIKLGDFWDWDGDPQTIDGVFYDLFVGNGVELQFEAINVYVQLAQRFKRPIRIHGFDNKFLDKIGICMDQNDKILHRK